MLLRKLAPVDLVLVEGYKREPHPKLEVYRAAVGKPLLHPDDPAIVAIASDAPLPKSPFRWSASMMSRVIADIDGAASRWRATTYWRVGARLMAQLSDDCFAFSGPLLPVAETERIIAERVVPVAEIETVPLAAASGRVLAS